ncbi:hypothetical protein H8356DRAFT_923745, partial [Neocallimastix lanati (nom. inval.)]
KKEILKFELLHSHHEKECDATLSMTKQKVKDEILFFLKKKKKKNSSLIPLGIKLKRIFNKILQENWGFRCPEYHTIKFQIIRNINNQTTF